MGTFCSHPREENLKRNTSFMFQNSYKNVAFENESGDLCDQKVDAIINVANNQLAHKSGLANTIVVKGGQVIQDESNKIIQETDGSLEIGTAVITSAGHLPAKYIIHVVSPIWNGGENGEEEKLALSVINALAKADEYRITSIAVPSVSGGSFGFPKEKCAAIMIKNCIEYIDSNPETGIKLIRFVNMEVLTVKAFKTELETVLSNSTSSPFSPNRDEQIDEKPTEEVNEEEAKPTADEVKAEETAEAVQAEQIEEIEEAQEQVPENQDNVVVENQNTEEVVEEKTEAQKEEEVVEAEKAEEAQEEAREQIPENQDFVDAKEEQVQEEEVYLEKSPVEVNNDPSE